MLLREAETSPKGRNAAYYGTSTTSPHSCVYEFPVMLLLRFLHEYECGYIDFGLHPASQMPPPAFEPLSLRQRVALSER